MGRWAHLYALPQWKKLREQHRHAHPCCAMCLDAGEVTPATITDHIRPHRGDMRLFLDPDNLQSLCKVHHDSSKQWEERRGMSGGCDADGNPLDARHPWNRRQQRERNT
jgi:5-methylcytosine-specific restriction enzyme A